jgi:L,D-transpeptidase ErfK/SrfK
VKRLPKWGMHTSVVALGWSVIAVSLGWAVPGLAMEGFQPAPNSMRSVPTLPIAAIEPPSLPPLGEAEQFLPIPITVLELVIRLGDRQVYVYEGDTLKASFPIAIGRTGWETPVGVHEVIQMVEDPAWENPFTGEVIPGGDRNNPLGRHWIGFWSDGTNLIGFHGTPNEESVGNAASHGCVRMYNRDVRQLFEMVELGTRVTVVP